MQPFLYELPEKVGKFPAGTILASGNGIPGGFSSTNIELHASTDKGKTWQFVSLVATGTAPNTTNSATPIWEPFLLYHDGELGVFYSDQRDPLHGMTTIAQIGEGEKARFMLSYELGMAPGPIDYAVGYRISDSPFTFGGAPDMQLVATDGTVPAAGPYTVWTPAGGPQGTIVVSDSTYAQVFTNSASGDPKKWIKQGIAKNQGISYTRSLTILPDAQGKKVLFLNGGFYGLREATVTAGQWVVPGDAVMDAKCIPGH
ncbi:glycoside hydrolase family 93 protein [Sphaerobolus stellatus SS14]|uniref:Glycoside hydrolase family 93 protein n=1 Tax=Sphaerobolus stellatus (strain SS14) TaxID=990650 RepID=A0A0C9UVK9_SPHS4|nr:glycoside hydrolase family 93 protein [Sphaerobolus stellatus SS14]